MTNTSSLFAFLSILLWRKRKRGERQRVGTNENVPEDSERNLGGYPAQVGNSSFKLFSFWL
jgi:hypothetical protein